jgi:L-lactate dehydrogenase complex protein LldG
MDKNARTATRRTANISGILEEQEMTERDKILGRIREALRAKAPLHGAASAHSAASPGVPITGGSPRRWLPAAAEEYEARVDQFRRTSEDLRASFHRVRGEADLNATLNQISREEKWNRIASHAGSFVSPIVANLRLPALMTDKGYAARDLESCDAGVTECDALIAQTGSVLITTRSAGGRALSVLPPHHVVVARREQLLPDLPAAFELLKQKYSANYPSFISFITGPSRTGDIERILVLGAHGPKKLTICFVG